MTSIPEENPVEEIQEAAQQAVRQETTSHPKREYRTVAFQVALFAAVGAFAVLTLMVKATPSFAVDVQITRALQSMDAPFFSAAMIAVSWLGFMPQSIIVPGLVVVFIYLLGLRWEAIVTIAAAFLPGFVNVLVKELIQRPRPTVDLVDVFRILESYSFPSGHVMFYIGFFGFLWFLAFTLLKRSWRRTMLLILLGLPIILVGPSRIYLGQHWASDILGAALLGGLVLVFLLQLYRWGKRRFFVDQPVAPS